MSNTARQFRPPTALAGMIDAFWIAADLPAAPGDDLAPTRVLPDGCMDLIFRWRERGHRQDTADMALFMTGTTTSAQLVTVEPGTCFAGVRLRPGMARTLVDADPMALAGRDVMATELDPAFGDLAEQLAAAARSGAPAVLSVLQREAGRRCASRMAHGPPPRIREALSCLGDVGPAVRVDRLARELGISPRSLHRDVLYWTGLPPKSIARILRFQHALALIRCPSRISLAEIALGAGYADQSHMTTEFRDLAGLTPSGMRRPPPGQSPIPARRRIAPGASFGPASCKEKT